MSKKKLFKNVYTGADFHVDRESGEIFNIIARNRKKINPKIKFIFIMDTDRIYELNGNELKIFIYLAQNSVMDDGCVYITKPVKEKLAQMFDVAEQSVADIVTRLVKKEALKRIGPSTYELNPEFGWKGSIESMNRKLNEDENNQSI